ncbi:MAG TPA: ABC transporter permease, partial [Gemmatimonadales bacterium]|nr:ABC transporter permease [Gemmatimonadales bacterium]
RGVFRLPLFRRRAVTQEVDAEIAFHLAMREAKLRAAGLSSTQASRIARDRFGDIEHIRQECVRESHARSRRERAMQWLDEARLDTRFAIRSLLRTKGFALAVVVTLALGIGANATIFAVTNAIILHPIGGIPRPEGVFELEDISSYPRYRDLRDRVAPVRLAAVRERRMALGSGTGIEYVTGGIASGNFFAMLDLPMAAGRGFGDGDDLAGAAPVAVLSHEYWTSGFGADPGIVGRTVTVNGAPVTVVGVTSPVFRGLHLGVAPAIWVPIHAWPLIAPPALKRNDLDSPNWGWLQVVGRVAPGGSLDQAEGALAGAVSALEPALPREFVRRQSTPRPLQSAALASGARDSTDRFIAILGGVVLLVLLTACANIAGLLLSRAASRQREIALRVALGAGRGRLIRQLLTESLLLAGAGGVAGLGLFLVARRAIAGAALPGGIAGSALDLGVDARLLGFAVLASVITGLLVGVMPALQATRVASAAALKRSAGQTLRGALVTAQVAVGLALLVGTGLFARSLGRALAVDLGFRPEPLAAFVADPTLAQYDGARSRAYVGAVLERLAAVPGVLGASWTAAAPLVNDSDRESADIEGYQPAAGETVLVEYSAVGPRYHQVLGLTMVAGRGLDERDTQGAPFVIVVNETFVKQYLTGRNPIGTSVTMFGIRASIVGVARDAKYHQLNESPRPYVYLPGLQGADIAATPIFIARVQGPAESMLRAVTDVARSVDPSVPVFDPNTMTGHLDGILAPQRAGAWLLGVFSVIALVVAAVGIYGIVAYSVSQRTREIGIRMALGAQPGSVLGLVARGSASFIVLGIPLGIVLALLLARSMTRFLFDIGSADPLTLAAMASAMVVIGIVAAWIPARRAVRIDPLRALRVDS